MKIQDHFPLKEVICQSKCKEFFCLKFPKDIFPPLRKQNNYKMLFSQAFSIPPHYAIYPFHVSQKRMFEIKLQLMSQLKQMSV